MDTKDAGRLGGLARAKNLTPAQLSAIGRKAVLARWAKRRRYVRAQRKAAKAGA